VTPGEHILRKRLEDGLTQEQLAALLGVDESTVLNWEKGHSKMIPAPQMPVLIQFLGYNPEIEPEAVGAHLRWKRRSLGWTIDEAARRNSVDSSTWGSWEKLVGWPAYPRYRDLLSEFLALPAHQLAAGTRRARPAGSR
jgi:DNA-binding XRE family transcriptional regulator